jgi:hypothetical protein
VLSRASSPGQTWGISTFGAGEDTCRRQFQTVELFRDGFQA